MVAAPEIHFSQWGVGWYASSLTDKQASVIVDMEVEKHIAASCKLEVRAALYDHTGKLVSQRRNPVSTVRRG